MYENILAFYYIKLDMYMCADNLMIKEIKARVDYIERL